MSVSEIGHLHSRYVRLSDKFKAIWTYNQFAAGVYKTFLLKPLPYNVNFQQTYDAIRKLCDVIQSAAAATAAPMMDRTEKDLQWVIKQLVEADQEITASILRRFFEKLRRQDDKIIFNLVKFYLYAEAVNGEQRDKLDFLFTRVSEDYVEERGEFAMKDSAELRKMFHGLIAVRPMNFGQQEEISNAVRLIRSLKDDILRAQAFDQLTEKNLLQRSREFKHNIGDRFFHPDVLVAVVDLNITTKNRFARLYQDEEQRLVEDARRLLDNEQAITRGFGETNPELLDELERFKQFKQVFDDSRARSDVKHQVIHQLKTSMNNILAQLDRGLDSSGEVEDVNDDLFLDFQAGDSVQQKFGDDPVLHSYLMRIVSILESFDVDDATSDRIGRSAEAKGLRLEPWEISAFQKLYWNRARGQGETDELLLLYLRGSALRIKIDEEAKILAAHRAHEEADEGLLGKVKASLDRAKELDAQFKDFLSDHLYSNPKNLHRLYRSRLRLLRGFSGLWLIYDQHAGGD